MPRLNKLFGVAEGFRGEPLAGEHAANFAGAFIAEEFGDGGDGSAIRLAFLYAVVVIGEGGDVRLMGNAKHLVGPA